jgi:hypothetical protein
LIVYVETNFLITLGLRQEQCEAADAILKLAQESRVDLAIPSLAILEAIHTVEGWQRRRKELSDGIGRELSQLRRSSAVPPLIRTLEMTIGELTRVGGDQLQDLQSAVERVLSIERVIDFTAATISSAISAQRSLALTAADSILYSTIANDVRHQPFGDPKCFLTTDDRFRSAIMTEFKKLGCRCIHSFPDGVSFIEKPMD